MPPQERFDLLGRTRTPLPAPSTDDTEAPTPLALELRRAGILLDTPGSVILTTPPPVKRREPSRPPRRGLHPDAVPVITERPPPIRRRAAPSVEPHGEAPLEDDVPEGPDLDAWTLEPAWQRAWEEDAQLTHPRRFEVSPGSVLLGMLRGGALVGGLWAVIAAELGAPQAAQMDAR